MGLGTAGAPETDLNVPKISPKSQQAQISTLTFTLQADELLRVAAPQDDIDGRDPALKARAPPLPSPLRRTIPPLG